MTIKPSATPDTRHEHWQPSPLPCMMLKSDLQTIQWCRRHNQQIAWGNDPIFPGYTPLIDAAAYHGPHFLLWLYGDVRACNGQLHPSDPWSVKMHKKQGRALELMGTFREATSWLF